MPRIVLSTTMCERKKSLKERLGAIMNYKKSTRLALICSVALVILLAGCAAILGAGERNRTVDEIIGSDDPRFRGVVEEVYDKAILVRVNEGEEIRKSSDLIDVSLLNANPDAAGGYSIGDTVCVYFDGVVAESYPAQVSAYAVLVKDRSPLGIIPDTINAPDFALEVAVDWAKGDFEGYRDIGVAAQKELGAAFDNWRLEYIEHAYRYDDMSIEIYRFEWRIHTTTPDKIMLAGGMELSEDGWLLDTYPGSWYLLFGYRDGELMFLTVMMANDCAPGDEAFTQDMLNRMRASGVALPARDMLNNVYRNSDLGIAWTFPESWNGEWNVSVFDNGNFELWGDGVNVRRIGSVIRYTPDEWENEFRNGDGVPVRYKVLANTADCVYVFLFASDLEWDMNNPDAEKTYNMMTEDIYNDKTVFSVSALDA
jgi:hypothetical protein